MIRTRFAPSPTGELHIGAARTALFSYLFAKHQEGIFLLRIEDTDRERFVEGSTERIVESLNWLGIIADNVDAPMVQSERLDKYRKAAFDLVNEGKAYICTCTKEKLAENREKQQKDNEPPHYEGHCRDANIDVKTLADGCYTIRMKMPRSGTIIVEDLIRGKVDFDAALQDDQIILKSDGYPTYHLASVIDDHEMEISHVIRSEEWLSSTPKHIVLYEMLGWKAPEFAHLSMILGPDHSKLSKRHGATSVLEYKNQGYLPAALVNFMALLGWNPKDEREIFSLEELIKEFDLKNVNKSGAIFDIEKLNWMNKHYLMVLTQDVVKNSLKEFNVDNVTNGEADLLRRGDFATLKNGAEYILKLRLEPEYDFAKLIFKKSDKEATIKGLELSLERLNDLGDWNANGLTVTLDEVVAKGDLQKGDVFWPIRFALCGEDRSPSPVELLLAVEKNESIKRLSKALNGIKQKN